MRNLTLGILSLFFVLLIASCAKEDKQEEVVNKLNNTTWNRIKLVEGGNEVSGAANVTLTFNGDGTFVYDEVSLDSTSSSNIESSWEVNTAGTQVNVFFVGDFEIVELTNDRLVWDYTENSVLIEETYAKQ